MSAGATAIAAMTLRRRCTIAGTVTSVRVCGRPSMRTDVVLADATGSAVLRFTGRDGLPGVGPGQKLVAKGTPARIRGSTIMMNPLYAFGTDESWG